MGWSIENNAPRKAISGCAHNIDQASENGVFTDFNTGCSAGGSAGTAHDHVGKRLYFTSKTLAHET
ncbi:hypothetical protein GCM10025785_24750 [Corynebacterium canis]